MSHLAGEKWPRSLTLINALEPGAVSIDTAPFFVALNLGARNVRPFFISMPYKTFPVKGGFKNWKVDEMGKKVGEPLSKEPLTEEDADNQRKALYAAEGKETTDTVEVENKEAGGDETKMYGDEAIMWLPPGVTSFAELDAYIESQEMAKDMRGDVEHFKDIASNIMMSDLVEDKAAALAALADEFAGRVGQSKKESDLIKEHLHYKEVMKVSEKATDDDFQGGCDHCGFGTKEHLKGFEKCPYCWNEF